MSARPPQIVAFGGGGFSMEWGNPLLDDHVLSLTGVPHPKVCFLPTASGDADHYVVRFYRAFAASRCQPSHISLFRRETGVGDPRAHLLDQDLIYVGGGSLVSLMGTWRAHGLDEALHDAWRAGVVLCGGSAGSLCWFSHAVSCFHDGPARALERHGRDTCSPTAPGAPPSASWRCGTWPRPPSPPSPPRTPRPPQPHRSRRRARCRPERWRRDRRRPRAWRRLSRCVILGAVSAQPASEDRRRILAMGGGGFTMQDRSAALDRLVLSLTGKAVPRICFLPTAGGDGRDQTTRFHERFSGWPCEPSVLSLFHLNRDRLDPREHLLAQDAIYVGGGSMRNMLAVWREHGVDAAMRSAWERGIVLAGLSAGAMCWFEGGITMSGGRRRRPPGWA